MKKIVVGMSGGVDSSMTLLLLKQQGWDPIGVSLKLAKWDSPTAECKENACCTEESFKRAKEICQKLGVEHHIYNVEKEFEKEVMGYFIEELKHRRTPNPCVICNRNLKIKHLLEWAKQHDIYYVATGHYAKIEHKDKSYLKLSKDPSKDQTYGFSMIPQEMLKHIILPLGDLTKEEVYKLAEKEGFKTYKKIKQSQDLCFVSKKDLPRFIEEKLGTNQGNIINQEGKILGKHKGLHFYTIGQTKKLNLLDKHYVKKFNPKENQLIVTKELEEVKSQDQIILKPYNFTLEEIKEPIEVTAKIRYGEFLEAKAILNPPKDGNLTITFHEPKHAVTPGQFCVFYKGDVCLGGGVITAGGEQVSSGSGVEPKLISLSKVDLIREEISKGKTFIYPTDTLYGLGCDATNKKAVQKIREIKKRDQKPFLIMVPNIDWIKNNCKFNHQEQLNKLPGPYSFIVKLKKEILAENTETIGVRIPDCTMKDIIQGPFVSTSVNVAGELPALTLEDIPDEIKKQVDYIIKSDKPLLGKPSQIRDLTQYEPKRLR